MTGRGAADKVSPPQASAQSATPVQIVRTPMSPMSVNTFDAKTLQAMAAHAAEDGPESPHGEKLERRVAQLATALIGVTLLLVVLV